MIPIIITSCQNINIVKINCNIADLIIIRFRSKIRTILLLNLNNLLLVISLFSSVFYEITEFPKNFSRSSLIHLL